MASMTACRPPPPPSFLFLQTETWSTEVGTYPGSLAGRPDTAGQQCWSRQLGAGNLPRPPAHIQGDSSGITNLGRFKESENTLALARLWELSRFPQWNFHLFFPHISASGRRDECENVQGPATGQGWRGAGQAQVCRASNVTQAPFLVVLT